MRKFLQFHNSGVFDVSLTISGAPIDDLIVAFSMCANSVFRESQKTGPTQQRLMKII